MRTEIPTPRDLGFYGAGPTRLARRRSRWEGPAPILVPGQFLYLFPLGDRSRATLLRQAAGRLAEPTLLCRL